MFCRKCGAKLTDDAKFCPACGTATEEKTNDFSQAVESFADTPDSTSSYSPEDIAANKGMAILSYFSWFVLIPLLAAKNSRFSRFHANQGLVLAIIETAWWIVEGVLSQLLIALLWALGVVISSLLALVNLLFLAWIIIGIVNAANGRARELPIIGKIHLLDV